MQFVLRRTLKLFLPSFNQQREGAERMYLGQARGVFFIEKSNLLHLFPCCILDLAHGKIDEHR